MLIQLTLLNGTEAVTVIAVPAAAVAGFGETETVTPARPRWSCSFDGRLHAAGCGAGRACHPRTDAGRIDEHLLDHERPAELDEADHHQKEDRRDNRELGRRDAAAQQAAATQLLIRRL